jgi:hypothetical protein
MESLKIHHYILPFLTLPVCLLLTGIYGWGSFATFTDRGGSNGSMYLYYQLSAGQYFMYEFIVTIAAFSILIAEIRGLITRNSNCLQIPIGGSMH